MWAPAGYGSNGAPSVRTRRNDLISLVSSTIPRRYSEHAHGDCPSGAATRRARAGGQRMYRPPLMSQQAPVTDAAVGDASRATVSAMNSACPGCPPESW